MYAALFLFLLFFNFVEFHVPMANYWDELATFLVFCWGAYDIYKTRKLAKGEIIDWICLAALVGIGALGNIVHPGLQTSKTAIIKDVVALMKFPAIFFVLQRRSVSREKQEKIIACIAKISRVVVIAALLGLIAGRFADLGFYTGEVRIVPTYQFVFSHPTF